jgi:uncharacterized protein (DUF4415 family)
MTDKTITTLSFDELPEEQESDWERFDAMTDEEIDYSDDPPLTEAERKQFRRAYFVKGEMVWRDEKTIGEWAKERGQVPQLIEVDHELAAWFLKQGEDLKAQINAVLRDYVEAHQ